MKKAHYIVVLFIAQGMASFGQALPDTAVVKQLSTITLVGQEQRNNISRLQPIVGTYILMGRKAK